MKKNGKSFPKAIALISMITLGCKSPSSGGGDSEFQSGPATSSEKLLGCYEALRIVQTRNLTPEMSRDLSMVKVLCFVNAKENAKPIKNYLIMYKDTKKTLIADTFDVEDVTNVESGGILLSGKPGSVLWLNTQEVLYTLSVGSSTPRICRIKIGKKLP